LKLALAISAAVAIAAPEARADDGVELRRMSFAERGGNLTVTTSFTELFDAGAYERLDSGVASLIVVRLYVYKKGEEMPISFVLANIRIAYELWDKIYEVRFEGPLGIRELRFNRRSDAFRAITSLERFPVAPLSRVAVGPHYFLGMVVELNPISRELLAEVRKWLSQRPGRSRLNAGSSFFGSFVSIFVNPKLAEADRILKLRSQPFYRTRR
jgi:hypothetical protein